jgi:hypothetical protein
MEPTEAGAKAPAMFGFAGCHGQFFEILDFGLERGTDT